MAFCEFKASMFQFSQDYIMRGDVCAHACVHVCTRAKVCFLKGPHRLFLFPLACGHLLRPLNSDHRRNVLFMVLIVCQSPSHIF